MDFLFTFNGETDQNEDYLALNFDDSYFLKTEPLSSDPNHASLAAFPSSSIFIDPFDMHFSKETEKDHFGTFSTTAGAAHPVNPTAYGFEPQNPCMNMTSSIASQINPIDIVQKSFDIDVHAMGLQNIQCPSPVAVNNRLMADTLVDQFFYSNQYQNPNFAYKERLEINNTPSYGAYPQSPATTSVIGSLDVLESTVSTLVIPFSSPFSQYSFESHNSNDQTNNSKLLLSNDANTVDTAVSTPCMNSAQQDLHTQSSHTIVKSGLERRVEAALATVGTCNKPVSFITPHVAKITRAPHPSKKRKRASSDSDCHNTNTDTKYPASTINETDLANKRLKQNMAGKRFRDKLKTDLQTALDRETMAKLQIVQLQAQLQVQQQSIENIKRREFALAQEIRALEEKEDQELQNFAHPFNALD